MLPLYISVFYTTDENVSLNETTGDATCDRFTCSVAGVLAVWHERVLRDTLTYVCTYPFSCSRLGSQSAERNVWCFVVPCEMAVPPFCFTI